MICCVLQDEETGSDVSGSSGSDVSGSDVSDTTSSDVSDSEWDQDWVRRIRALWFAAVVYHVFLIISHSFSAACMYAFKVIRRFIGLER
jgi:hypothetical protein